MVPKEKAHCTVTGTREEGAAEAAMISTTAVVDTNTGVEVVHIVLEVIVKMRSAAVAVEEEATGKTAFRCTIGHTEIEVGAGVAGVAPPRIVMKTCQDWRRGPAGRKHS